MTFDEWVVAFRTSTLNTGDYYVGYKDSVAPNGVIQVQLSGAQTEYGAISYNKDYPAQMLFNKDVRSTQTTVALGSTDGTASQAIFLPIFPAFDESSLGTLDLDSFSLFVNAVEWTRVADFTASGAADLHFTLDAEYGIVRLGDGTNGFKPAADLAVTATYTAVPFVQYEPTAALGYFRDKALNLDPVTNSPGS